MTNRNFALIFWLCLLLLATIRTAPAAELPPLQKLPLILPADQVLRQELLEGPNYRIEPEVKNDGFINVYRLQTDYGPLEVESTALLMERLQELTALRHMEELKKTEVFKEALMAGGKGPLQAAKGLVTEPVETTKGIVTGVGRWFSDVGHSIVSDDPHQEGVVKTVIGHAPAKRKFAYEFKVDPYSDFEPLQEVLNDIAWAATGGGLTPKVAFAAIGGTAGTILQATGTAEGMRKLVRDKSPAELDDINEEIMRQMNIPTAAAMALLDNHHYNPQEKTFLVGALQRMEGVAHRGTFVAIAARADDPSVARSMRIRAEMMANYADRVAGVNKIIDLNGVPSLLRQDGIVVGLVPLDYVAWTEALQRKERALSATIARYPEIRGKELRIEGRFDPAARIALEALGWKLSERFRE